MATEPNQKNLQERVAASRLTINEIAAECSLHPQTVTKVLRGDTTHRNSVTKVLRAVEHLENTRRLYEQESVFYLPKGEPRVAHPPDDMSFFIKEYSSLGARLGAFLQQAVAEGARPSQADCEAISASLEMVLGQIKALKTA